MTIKELKNIINNIDEKYDNKEIITDDKEYDEYSIGDSFVNIKDVEHYEFKGFYFLKLGTE